MFFTTACSRTVATESGREEARKDNKTNGNCTGQDAAGNVRDAAMVDMGVKPITDLVIESRHCAAAFSLQMLKSCTHLDLTFLYILTLRTYSKFVRKNKMLALCVCFPQPCQRVADPRTLQGCGDPRTLFLKRVRGGPFFEKINTAMVRGATERRP